MFAVVGIRMIWLTLYFLLAAPLFCLNAEGAVTQRTSDEPDDPSYIIETAHCLVGKYTTPPDFSMADECSLPHLWGHDPGGFYGSVWYRLILPARPKQPQQWAVLIEDINMNAELWLGDGKGKRIRIGSGGSIQKPVSRYWHAPLMLPVSYSDLKHAEFLYIRVVAYANEFGKLGKLVIGPYDVVDKQYQLRYFSITNVHIISASLGSVYALLMLVVWKRRRDPVFFWGALVCLAWAASSLNLFLVNPPVSELVWEKLMQMSMGWIPLFFYFFILRIDNVPWRKRHDIPVLTIALLINLVLLVADQRQLFAVSRVWHMYALLLGLWAIVLLFLSWRKRQRKHQLIIIVMLSVIAVAGIHDFYVQNLSDNRTEQYWLDYSMIVLLIMIGLLMVLRFLDAVRTTEKLNRDLEGRVREAQERVERYYETILMLEKESAVQAERERIYRDMHDDMGGKLLSMVYQAKNDEMRRLARAAMDDLRAIVSRKRVKPGSLRVLFDSWYRETKKRCRLAGIECGWSQTISFADTAFRPEAGVHLERVFNEAITNAIKHGSGNRLGIVVARRMGYLYVKVVSGGNFENIAQWSEGRGLSSMRYRIAKLGGTIHWRALLQGGYVSFVVPIRGNSI